MKKIIITSSNSKLVKNRKDSNSNAESANNRITSSNAVPLWVEEFNSIVKKISPATAENTKFDETVVTDKNLNDEYGHTNGFGGNRSVFNRSSNR